MARRSRRPPPGRDPFDPLDGDRDDIIDLHQLTADQARARVQSELDRVRKAKPGALVHIITGKGKHSNGQPVLKGTIRKLLRSGTLTQVARWDLDLDEGGFLVRLKGGRF